eukprot:CAMPEP_0198235532 /NCGR_PEP_ID=MMETSP1446-20131203/1442_1 /TAXON_ID=1461542 ORGANISM="Unidentified sp, Strain CCMP2111" /NCGR_SAMPLE_ID=MMETSP1446 /ASSEMBLY_ACC=CAM_ASM_001112 /LENGTH=299 /DNA_ID=CAMNT_0043916781 /DNA_START=172 /DNA_END=1069 /DNA_ORIENTATION=-
MIQAKHRALESLFSTSRFVTGFSSAAVPSLSCPFCADGGSLGCLRWGISGLACTLKGCYHPGDDAGEDGRRGDGAGGFSQDFDHCDGKHHAHPGPGPGPGPDPDPDPCTVRGVPASLVVAVPAPARTRRTPPTPAGFTSIVTLVVAAGVATGAIAADIAPPELPEPAIHLLLDLLLPLDFLGFRADELLRDPARGLLRADEQLPSSIMNCAVLPSRKGVSCICIILGSNSFSSRRLKTSPTRTSSSKLRRPVTLSATHGRMASRSTLAMSTGMRSSSGNCIVLSSFLSLLENRASWPAP